MEEETQVANGPLHGQWALITGASGGAGYLAARALAQTGANLYLSGVNFMNLDTTARNIRDDFGVELEIHTGNPALEGDAGAIGMACADAHVFVNCTGNLPKGTLDDLEDERWRKSWEAAVFAPINLCREMISHMEDEHRGLIVLMIDSPGKPDAEDICATVAGGALKAFVKAEGQASAKGVKVLGLVTNRELDSNAFSMAISRLA